MKDVYIRLNSFIVILVKNNNRNQIDDSTYNLPQNLVVNDKSTAPQKHQIDILFKTCFNKINY